jgi:hypothetical protein
MSYDSTMSYMRDIVREQEAKQRQELREQEAKRLEAEHLEDIRKSKEELSVIAAPPGWDIKESIADDADQIKPDMVVASDSQDGEKGLLKLQKQQAAILKVIKDKKFKPMEIPDGEKGTIRQICESDYPELFDGTYSFDNAWKNGRGLLFRMANHASYAKRGKK